MCAEWRFYSPDNPQEPCLPPRRHPFVTSVRCRLPATLAPPVPGERAGAVLPDDSQSRLMIVDPSPTENGERVALFGRLDFRQG